MARDYYEVLGVSRDAGPEELQQAFRRLARANHPDVNKDPGAEERFKEINEAYQVLSDPELRKRYDRFGEDYRRVPEDWEERVGAGVGGVGAGPGRYSGGRRYGGARGYGADFGADLGGGFGGVDLDDLFGGLFGGRGRDRMGRVPGADQEAELPLTVEEAYRGGRRQVTLNGPDGPRTYTVTIPAGVSDGRRIRLAGEGGRGIGGGPPGDLYLVVRLLPHARYRVEGKDITVELPLAPWEAALGANVPVLTPAGETTVVVPPGSSTGRRLRLRGEGMPDQGGRPGDLYAEVKVMVPPRLSDQERELFTELAAVSTFDPRGTGFKDPRGSRS
ncbi:chaperone DnaJ domain protein [Pseudonocardia dioxanivorans CB1190]|jgi:curved DNA-binding protein|uniref:Chaperone DnaJ domain protein n=1 Tax=Pseudonocardia dioxanivorans (strain ATCC 55486 / DSM 44775 / JCM 13855 / CB1190) TaxID=675635 RepID=F4CZD3_PSEUX|nr:J domain-containing protein [Pseudonocardia dioxanivorans]AEA25664.1 chaperone DnaJ domain protein [Pseudonocardia dioxanivorans CB1190]